MDKLRNAHIDFGAGIMILWMIFQHAVQSAWGIDPSHPNDILGSNPNVWIPYLNFFMPWFFYKSGAFFQKRSVKELWHKDYNKFLKTFIVWTIVGYICYLMLGFYDHTLTLHDALYTPTRRFFLSGFMPIEGPLWFLLTLFGVRFLLNILLPYECDKYFHIKCTLIVIMGVVMASIENYTDYFLTPMWIGNGFAGLVYFTLGYWLHKYEKNLLLIIPCVIGYICCCVFGWNIVVMQNNILLEGHYLLWFPCSLCGIVTFNAACRMWCDWKCKYAPPTIRNGLFEIIGKNAMPLYVMHAFIEYPICTILIHTNHLLLWVYTIAIICGSEALFLPIVCVLWNKISKMKTK